MMVRKHLVFHVDSIHSGIGLMCVEYSALCALLLCLVLRGPGYTRACSKLLECLSTELLRSGVHPNLV